MPARVLDAAFATFARFGYRKTSMEEVARTAGLSRQGLYLHFATKEELFRAVISHACETGYAAAAQRVREAHAIDEQLIGAFDEWTGRYIGLVEGTVSDLHEATGSLGSEILVAAEARFIELVARAIRDSKLATAFKAAKITPRQLAESLGATARGLKTLCTTRAQFAERIAIAVRVMCR